MLGVHLQRAVLLTLLAALPICGLWSQTARVLHGIGAHLQLEVESG